MVAWSECVGNGPSISVSRGGVTRVGSWLIFFWRDGIIGAVAYQNAGESDA